MIIKTKRFSAEITAATQYATIYNSEDKPAATLQRRRAYENGPVWRMFDTAGIELGDGFAFAGTAIRLLDRIGAQLEAAVL